VRRVAPHHPTRTNAEPDEHETAAAGMRAGNATTLVSAAALGELPAHAARRGAVTVAPLTRSDAVPD
jgi:hypothetical protein